MKMLRTFSTALVVSVLFVLVALVTMGPSTDGDKQIVVQPYEHWGERHWFATPTGTGDCRSWNHACTFRTAAGKTTSVVHDVLHVGAGTHDLDNGVDADGTTISVGNVTVLGVADSCTGGPRLVNGDAAAVYVLRSTGDSFILRNIYFDNTGQTDEDVIFLNIQGSRALVDDVTFVQTGTATAGVGVLLDNSGDNCTLRNLTFEGVQDEAIKTNGYSYLKVRDIQIDNCGVGVSIAGAGDSNIDSEDLIIKNSTTGVSITGATASSNNFEHVLFVHNTTNIVDVTAYDNAHWQDVSPSHQRVLTYPVTAGVAVATGDGAWAWSAAAVQIVPADTINNPFYITQVNFQDYDASQTFKVELLWGETAGDNSLGVYEVTTGAAIQGFFIPVNLAVVLAAIPAGSYVGAKSMSSTAGVDSVTFSISYQEL